jgi:hypothetical protein
VKPCQKRAAFAAGAVEKVTLAPEIVKPTPNINGKLSQTIVVAGIGATLPTVVKTVRFPFGDC